MQAVAIDKPTVIRNFAARVAFARLVRDMRMHQVAKRATLTQGAVSHLEAGHTDVKLHTLVKLAIGLDVAPWWLGEVGDPDVPPTWPGASMRRAQHDVTAIILGGRLALTRNWRELSQAQLAARMGPVGAKRTLASYENGTKVPHLTMVHHLAAGLDVPVGFMLGDLRARPWA